MADEEAYTRSDMVSNYGSWIEYHSDDEAVQEGEKNKYNLDNEYYLDGEELDETDRDT